ncbi:MAG: PEP-CTERM sorting domain-containing protein [Phycisphaeraceae bacterium]|nr:PEP-CTERM sorting domain-containing protein [Phycisphaeraceae bacterium]
MTAPAFATSVPLLNQGFELMDLPGSPDGAGGTFFHDIENWDEFESHSYGILLIHNNATTPQPVQTPYGDQCAAVSNRAAVGSETQMTQMVYDGVGSGLLSGATYTLTASMIRTESVANAWLRYGLYEDAAMTVPYDNVVCDTIALTDTAWNDFTASFTVDPADVGKALYIGFENDGATTILTRWFIDNVRLDMEGGLQPGDANHDGMVNLADLQILGDNWQATSANWEQADFTGDGSVNLADLQVLGDNWGYGTGPDVAFDEALAQVAIPEPTTLGLLGLSGLLALRRRSMG